MAHRAPTKGSLLDRFAISMAVLCAIHCLLTPLLLVAMPILATTFWVSEDFHLWMILLVIPSSGIAFFTGCMRHKDQWVAVLALLGIAVLMVSLIIERTYASGVAGEACPHCVGGHGEVAVHSTVTWNALLNTLGGLFLIAGHVRNYILCRRDDCHHGHGHDCEE